MGSSLNTLVLCLGLREIKELTLENFFSEVGPSLFSSHLKGQMIFLESFLWVLQITATGSVTWQYEPRRMGLPFSGFHPNEIIILVQTPERAQMYSTEEFLFYPPQW